MLCLPAPHQDSLSKRVSPIALSRHPLSINHTRSRSIVRAPWLKEGESQGMPVSSSLGDPILSAHEVRHVDFAKFVVAALEDNSLVLKAPAIARARRSKL